MRLVEWAALGNIRRYRGVLEGELEKIGPNLYEFVKSAAIFAAISVAPAAAFASSFTLDFGNVTASSFGTTGNLTIEYLEVADGINATLTATDTFSSSPRSNNGSISGDIRVNATNSQDVEMTLTLFDSTVGDDGFTTLYDPGTDFDWDLGFYDIDGWDTRPNEYYDVVTIDTTNIGAMSYTVTESTGLVITSDDDSVSFSGTNTGGIAGQTGLDGELSQAQSDVSMILSLSNTPTVTFTYSVFGTDNRTRNLLVDGGAISLAGETVTTAVAPVPLPAPGALMVAGLAGLGIARRMRKS